MIEPVAIAELLLLGALPGHALAAWRDDPRPSVRGLMLVAAWVAAWHLLESAGSQYPGVGWMGIGLMAGALVWQWRAYSRGEGLAKQFGAAMALWLGVALTTQRLLLAVLLVVLASAAYGLPLLDPGRAGRRRAE